ncbi:PhnD/SsuA/transferrin family substrate-binding protein [Cupriavidus cauae]|uniref:phosphate/phosphite/phosphonate ABC transporter substrate-binding protein n=1 Tax=Cupriavidus cauae TaxID=2608999 RepID=UPI002244044F|nr:PhnD/SsuA/transferrin family substrate-binding protein [Cupriavidus cauae]UZN51749.1 PhnD/SsuA/transferrin family substrate-binding protein [Cupriavidus cauae]
MIANARMYSVSPQAGAAWRTLLMRVAQRAGVELAYVEHDAPAPIRALWERDDCACVLMCGYPFATAPVRYRLLAAPVPDLPRYGGLPRYFSEFIVRADSPCASLAQTFGTRLACMLPESNSGYNAPRRYLMEFGLVDGALYLPTEAATPTPQDVIDAVIAGRAEVGVVDSYVLDLLRLHAPGRIAALRTLAVTQSSPIPPLVASPGIDEEIAARLRGALLDAHRDPDCAEALATLRLARFAAVEPGDYRRLVRWAREADHAGVALTAATPVAQGLSSPLSQPSSRPSSQPLSEPLSEPLSKPLPHPSDPLA